MILAVPRSGTNFFCECLDAFPEVTAYFELFNPAGAFGIGPQVLPVVAERLGVNDPSSHKDPRFAQAFREDPARSLRMLAEASRSTGVSTISYKIFPRQMSDEALGQLMQDDRRHVLFITRRRLDVFVSYLKARESGSWVRGSTADVLPAVNVDEFLSWARETDEWYAAGLDLARRYSKKIVIARYESDIDRPKPEVVRRASHALSQFGVHVTVPVEATGQRFRRQDKRKRPFKKIANGPELRDALRGRRKLKYALGAPLDRLADRYRFASDQGQS